MAYSTKSYMGKSLAEVSAQIMSKYKNRDTMIDNNSQYAEHRLHLLPKNEKARMENEQQQMMKWGGVPMYPDGGPFQIDPSWMNQQIGHASAIQGGLANPLPLSNTWLNNQINTVTPTQVPVAYAGDSTTSNSTNTRGFNFTGAQTFTTGNEAKVSTKPGDTPSGSFTTGDALGILAPLALSAYYGAQSRRKPEQAKENPYLGRYLSKLGQMGVNDQAFRNQAHRANQGYVRAANSGRSYAARQGNLQEYYNKYQGNLSEIEARKQAMMNQILAQQAQGYMAAGADKVRVHDQNIAYKMDRERYQHQAANLIGTGMERAGQAYNQNLYNRQAFNILGQMLPEFGLINYGQFMNPTNNQNILTYKT